MALKLWTYDEYDGDYYVAESAEEADELMKKHATHTLEELMKQEGFEGEWVAMPDDVELTIFVEGGTYEGLEEGDHTKTASEWCALNGKGYIFSKNFLRSADYDEHGLRLRAPHLPATALRRAR